MDIKNPQSGGSEVYAHEMCKRLAEKFNVYYLTSNFKNSRPNEIIDNVKILRKGNIFTLYIRAFFWLKENRSRFDTVVEIINGPPFLVPLITRSFNHYIVIYHLITFSATCERLPLIGPLEYVFSRKLLKLLYKKVPTITDSNSGRSELISIGFSKVFVAEDGIDKTESLNQDYTIPKENLVVITGPLKSTKRIEHGIMAFASIANSWKLQIIGRGPQRYLHRLMEIVESLNISHSVKFLGYVSEDEKKQIYSRSKINIVTSEKEGYGLTVLECARYGCVAVGYDVDGVRDAIVDGYTGILVQNGDITRLRSELSRLASDDDRLVRMSKACISFAIDRTWDRTFEIFKNIITDGAVYNNS